MIHTKGDLLKTFEKGDVDVIAHCCNCCGVMGSGIAFTIKQQYPAAYKAYKDFELYNDNKIRLSTISYAKHNQNQYIVNLHAQQTFGSGASVRYVNYEALYNTLEQTRNLMIEKKVKRLGVPYKMACDRAGGDWRIVEVMLNVIFDDQFTIHVVSL